MRLPILVALVLCLGAPDLSAQRPIFSPVEKPTPPPAAKPAGAPDDGAAAKPAEPGAKGAGAAGKGVPADAKPAPVEAVPADPVQALMQRLAAWPQPRARDAALVLAGLGPEAKAALLQGLRNNDWRVQAGASFALAEMGEKDALPALKLALSDPSTRAGIAEIMQAITKLDPENGPSLVMPFVSHQSARVRRAAIDALPLALPEKLLPEVQGLVRNQRGPVRASGLELLARIPGGSERDEWITALADPDAQVGLAAVRHLGQLGTKETRARLLDHATNAPSRPATYAMLALVHDEDVHGISVLPESGELRTRVDKQLRAEDPFYRGAAAVVLANLSYRSEEAALRKLADEHLVPILLGAVAGGVFYSDYTTLEEFCWRKLELLSGERFGQTAQAWRNWWQRTEGRFTARRELRTLLPEDLDRARVLCSRSSRDGGSSQIYVSGVEADFGSEDALAPLVLDVTRKEALGGVIRAVGLFESRGEVEDPARLDGSIRIAVSLAGSTTQFVRFHHGAVPEALRPLVEHLEGLERDLAWQRFLRGRTAEERRADAEAQRGFFADPGLKPEDRDARLRELAIVSYPEARGASRRLALAVFEAAPVEWRRANEPALAALLSSPRATPAETTRLIDLIAEVASPATRDLVFSLLTKDDSARSDAALGVFAARQTKEALVAMMTDGRPRVRAAAAAALARFPGDAELAGLLIGGLNDSDGPVREACVRSLAAVKDDRVLGMLDTVLASDDLALKHRAVVALGTVGKEQAVPRLMELYREGDARLRWTIVRALKEAGGKRARVALTGIVLDPGEVDLRREALDVLVDTGRKDAFDDLATIVAKAVEPELRIRAMTGIVKVRPDAAAEVVRPLLADQDKAVARVAMLSLARSGATEAVPLLLAHLESAVEGDLAAERALEELTFHCPDNPSPPRRIEAQKVWAQSSAAKDRAAWLSEAASLIGLELDASVDWLAGQTLSKIQLTTLVALLEKGNRALRLFADARLQAVSGRDLPDLSPLALRPEVEDRLAVWRGYLAEPGTAGR